MEHRENASHWPLYILGLILIIIFAFFIDDLYVLCQSFLQKILQALR